MIHTCVECGKNFTGRKKKYCSDECFKEKRRRDNRERMRKINRPKPDVTITCEWCGKEHTVPARTAHQARFCSDKCKDTWWSRVVKEHRPIDEYTEERRRQKLIRQERLEKERAIKSLRRSIQSIIKIKKEEQRIIDLTRECVECGKKFYNPSRAVLVCSSECSRKRSRRLSRMAYKGRINEYNLVDKDISLTRLYKKDGGVCYICGERCDWLDKEVTEEGYTIVGDKYPTIEHVIPLSKGGKHSWNNVRLACKRCNTLKRDNLINDKSDCLV